LIDQSHQIVNIELDEDIQTKKQKKKSKKDTTPDSDSPTAEDASDAKTGKLETSDMESKTKSDGEEPAEEVLPVVIPEEGTVKKAKVERDKKKKKKRQSKINLEIPKAETQPTTTIETTSPMTTAPTPTVPTESTPLNNSTDNLISSANSNEKEEEDKAPQDAAENRGSLLTTLKNAVGLDITTISLPVWLNEPTTFLQRLCEMMEYYELLDWADQQQDSCHRMAFVAAFIATKLNVNCRTQKPFNPFLGETFEHVTPKFKFVGEQVKHHPPVGTSVSETDHFVYFQEQGLVTKFAVNSLAGESRGFQHLYLKKSGDHYSWSGIKSMVHNAVIGKMWIDHFGDCEIVNYKTKEKCRLEFRKCGWFSKGRYEVRGWILNASGETKMTLVGKWNDAIYASVEKPNPIQPSPETLKSAEGKALPSNVDKGSDVVPIWINRTQFVERGSWNLPEFAHTLNELDENMRKYLPKTDSRLRPDRIALEKRDLSVAGSEKRRMEQKQRDQRKSRESKGEKWAPRHFKLKVEPDSGEEYWHFASSYWDEREQRLQNAEQVSHVKGTTFFM
jgi:hypothetical protein